MAVVSTKRKIMYPFYLHFQLQWAAVFFSLPYKLLFSIIKIFISELGITINNVNLTKSCYKSV